MWTLSGTNALVFNWVNNDGSTAPGTLVYVASANAFTYTGDLAVFRIRFSPGNAVVSWPQSCFGSTPLTRFADVHVLRRSHVNARTGLRTTARTIRRMVLTASLAHVPHMQSADVERQSVRNE